MIRSPDDAPVKSKMLFASSKDALRKALVGIHLEVQGTDSSEVEYETGM
jgi:cofilin